MNKRKEWMKNLLGVILVAVFLFPVYWMIITAFKTQTEIFQSPPTFFPKEFQISSFITILQGGDITQYFMNSVIISSLATLLVLLLAVPSAYGLARFKIRGIKTMLLIYLVTQMLPATVVLTPLFIVFNNLNLLNSYWGGPVLATSTLGIPFSVLLLRTFFIGIPKELEEAAKIDGCSRLRAFLQVIIPISIPSIVVCGAISFFFAWGDLIYSITFNRNQDLWPLTAGIYNAIGRYGIEWNNLMSFATISVIPVIIIFILLQKHLVEGLVSGSVK
ncbi:alpha-xyloside ABC transporter [Gracilibacillus boraciitolerans JCM 21714]|uniref:Alpha-xyloside ABC transporter n=1 Tax=Gracilibacillus boraciitolerans JCM 21714 TaxID=1298598 RepID=W4VHX7_9BACI|nr:carbohydrate ABC transporter permease [Gracilibacillus boraciitolerans]GAE92771.1 alpha-xyloside ABC transporter [Gracilibacillus boraciitolerans JCM 21714]